MKKPLSQVLSSLVVAARNCEKSGNTEWFERHSEKLYALVKEHMPSGSGVDNGTEIVFVRSGGSRLTFTCDFHHMNDAGYYDGWTQHTVTVRPDFCYGFHITVSGRNRNDICDYLAELFTSALATDVEV